MCGRVPTISSKSHHSVLEVLFMSIRNLLPDCACSSASGAQAVLLPDSLQLIPDLDAPPANIPIVSTTLSWSDRIGGWKARWDINRMDYAVAPGIYQVGEADQDSPVLVTANYKMSFDMLRRELGGLNAWILVLDTDGINVWCAAGKGTFGTAELAKRILLTGLSRLVTHRTVILPQLGAPGVAAHQVKSMTGFRVVYGPVRAADLPAFLAAQMKASPEMRDVHFNFLDRLVTTPVELVATIRPVAVILLLLLLVRMFGLLNIGFMDVYPFIGAVLAGALITPALLPWIPGRAFALKGWLIGLLWTAGCIYLNGVLNQSGGFWGAGAELLLYPAISSFLAMNYTGASTYTSLSGVKKEMKYAVPLQAISAGLGLILGIISLWK